MLHCVSVYSTMGRKDQGRRGEEEEASCLPDLPKSSSSNKHRNNSKPHSHSPHPPRKKTSPISLPPSSLPSLLPLPRLWKALWPPYPLPLPPPLWTSPPRLPFPLWPYSHSPTALSVRNSGRTRWPDPPYSLTSNVSHTTSGQ